ncbi:hypothetical protein ACTMP8_24370, partial [Escherichia coli]|uniref:hypothetical protein n=1 Tax=Escherichia coli TaxID=562 RepID=UPI003F89875C
VVRVLELPPVIDHVACRTEDMDMEILAELHRFALDFVAKQGPMRASEQIEKPCQPAARIQNRRIRGAVAGIPLHARSRFVI